MRGKNFNTGLRGVLFESGHYERMGAAIWLYGWLVLRQTHQAGGVGWVLGGAPISYREIEEETGFNRRTLERWLRLLRQQGYIQTEAAQGGFSVRITKAKKFADPRRRFEEGARKFGGGATQICGVSAQQSLSFSCDAGGMGSSSVAGEIESKAHHEFTTQTQNRTGLGKLQVLPEGDHPGPIQNRPHYPSQNSHYEARERQRLLRYEREEAVRRELAVGTGPEVISK